MRHLRLFTVVVVALLLAAALPASAQSDGRLNEHTLEMAVYCNSGGVDVYRVIGSVGRLALRTTRVQMGTALAQALANHQDVRVAVNSDVNLTLWALGSNNFMASLNPARNGEPYNFVFAPTTCGAVYRPSTVPPLGTTVPGTGLGLGTTTGTTPTTTGTTTQPPIYLPVYVDTRGTASTTGTQPLLLPVYIGDSGQTATADGSYYIVQPGDNLFRIGLRFGLHYTELARINNIVDPTRIYVGQQIFIPHR